MEGKYHSVTIYIVKQAYAGYCLGVIAKCCILQRPFFYLALQNDLCLDYPRRSDSLSTNVGRKGPTFTMASHLINTSHSLIDSKLVHFKKSAQHLKTY